MVVGFVFVFCDVEVFLLMDFFFVYVLDGY